MQVKQGFCHICKHSLFNFVNLFACAAAYMMVKFLYEAGFPYLALRTAVRSNNSAAINDMYVYMINVFRATNKVMYAKLCVINLHTLNILTPELRVVWERYRTASLRGKIGRNVGWDFTLERMNLEVSNMLGSSISPEHIQECIRLLNGIKYVRPRALEAFGIGEDPESRDYNGILESDITAVVQTLKEAFGFDGNNDFEKLTSSKANIFRSPDAETPWSRIAEVIRNESTEVYVSRTLQRAPRNTFS